MILSLYEQSQQPQASASADCAKLLSILSGNGLILSKWETHPGLFRRLLAACHHALSRQASGLILNPVRVWPATL